MNENVLPPNFYYYTKEDINKIQKDISSNKILEDISSNKILEDINRKYDAFIKLQSQDAFKTVIEEEKNKPYFQAAKYDSINYYNLSVKVDEANDKVIDLKEKLKEEFNRASQATLEKTLPEFQTYDDAYNNAKLAKTEAKNAITKSDNLEKAVLLAETSISASINNSSAIAAYNVALVDAAKAKKEATIAVTKSASLEQEADNALKQISVATGINADPIFATFDVIFAEYISAKKEADIAYDNSIVAARKAKASVRILDITIKPLIEAKILAETNAKTNIDKDKDINNIFTNFTKFKAKKPELLQAYIQGYSIIAPAKAKAERERKEEVLKKIIEEEYNKPYYKDAYSDQEKAYTLSAIAETAIAKAKFLIARTEKEYKAEKIANTDFCNVINNSTKKEAEIAKTEALAAIAAAYEAANKADSSLLSLEVKIKALIKLAL
jgi:hypothetical protein